MFSIRPFAVVFLGSIAALTGCTSYTVPGGPAELGPLLALKNDQSIHTATDLKRHFDAKPLADFPAMLAVAHVQDGRYRSPHAYGHGRFSVITTRDPQAQPAIDRVAALPQVRGLAPLSRLLLPERLDTENDLRTAAARVKADILLIYTYDTQFYVRDFAKPVSVFTLGLSPNKKAFVTTTASAVLIDTRSGYIYGGAEASAQSSQLASGWTSEDAVDDTRVRTERESFEKLVAELEREWPRVVKQYAGVTK